MFSFTWADPENALRELAKADFDIALSQATTFADKFQRATTTLSVTEVCIQNALHRTGQSQKDRHR